MNKYYVLGLYLGDGCVTVKRVNKDGSVYYRAVFIVKDSVSELFRRWLTSNGINHRIAREIREKRREGYIHEIMSDNQRFCKWLVKECGMLKDKHLPDYSKWTPEQKADFLSGYLDSDGSVDKESVYLFSTKKQIIEGLVEMADSYGVEFSSVREYKTSFTTVYRARFKNSTLRKSFLNPRVDYKKNNFDTIIAHLKPAQNGGT